MIVIGIVAVIAMLALCAWWVVEWRSDSSEVEEVDPARRTEDPTPTTGPVEDHADHADPDALVDEMSEESFPGSDPPATWAGPDEATRRA